MSAFVFLDTQVYEAASFNIRSTYFRTLASHLESGRLRLVMTDITRTEVLARIDGGYKKELASLKRLRRESRILRSAHAIQELGLFRDQHDESARVSLHRAVHRFLDDHDTTVVEATAGGAKEVFTRYFASKPPFALGRKRKEFPDAFVVEALIAWTDRHSHDLLIVSGDALFRAACDEGERIRTFENLPLLLRFIAADDRILADFLRDQIMSCQRQIEETARQEFEGLGFYIEDEWGEVEVKVTGMNLEWEPELIFVSGSEATVELGFEAQYDAFLSYDDSSTGTYDREEDRHMFMDHVTKTVCGSASLVVTVTAVFDVTDADLFEIQSIDLAQPVEGLGIPASTEYRK